MDTSSLRLLQIGKSEDGNVISGSLSSFHLDEHPFFEVLICHEASASSEHGELALDAASVVIDKNLESALRAVRSLYDAEILDSQIV